MLFSGSRGGLPGQRTTQCHNISIGHHQVYHMPCPDKKRMLIKLNGFPIKCDSTNKSTWPWKYFAMYVRRVNELSVAVTYMVFQSQLLTVCWTVWYSHRVFPNGGHVTGITNFDLLGEFGRIEWLGSFVLVLGYNAVFAATVTLSLASKFTASVRRELYNRLVENITTLAHCVCFLNNWFVHVLLTYMCNTNKHFSKVTKKECYFLFYQYESVMHWNLYLNIKVDKVTSFLLTLKW